MSEFQKVGNQELLRKNWDAIFSPKTSVHQSTDLHGMNCDCFKCKDPEDDLDPNEVLRKYYEDAGVPLD
tara:strand:+ start:6660 stop:6866 length:207 start_codon:yes stop_codon:yes gene_type:complete